MATDDNSPQTVAHQYDPSSPLVAENASLRARLDALERQNVIEGRFSGEVPRYQLNERGFYDDTLFEAGSIIDYIDPPNLTMVPLNEAARTRLQAQIDHQVDGGREVAMLNNRRYVGLVNDRNVLIGDAMADAKAKAAVIIPTLDMPKPYAPPPPMPHTEEAQALQRRGPGRPRKAMQIGEVAPGAMDRGAPVLAPYAPDKMEPMRIAPVRAGGSV